MKRQIGCVILLFGCSILGMRSLVFGDPSFSVWSIGSPSASPTVTFTGSIPASGGVGYSKAFILRVEGSQNEVLAGTNGNGTPDSWSATVSEPSEGWVPGSSTVRSAILRLIVDGETDNTVAITLAD
jgi:hypothetical protein